MAAVVLALALLPCAVRADDHGPQHSIARVRSDAKRLLTYRVRKSGVDPSGITVTDVVTIANQAVLSWDAGNLHGVMGLVYLDDRWWDALDLLADPRNTGCWQPTRAYPLLQPTPYGAPFAGGSLMPPPSSETLLDDGMSKALVDLAAAHNADVMHANAGAPMNRPGAAVRPGCHADGYEVRPDLRIRNGGAVIHPPFRGWTSGYDLTVKYAPNDAAADSTFASIFVRAPSAAEILPYPVPSSSAGGPTDIAYFNITLDGTKAVTFQSGTTFDIWFPFVLDDTLRYDISYFTNDTSYGPYHGTIYDNVLHFELPALTIVPDKPLKVEISGWY